MRSKDMMEQARAAFAAEFLEAVNAGDADRMAKAVESLSEGIQNALMEEYRENGYDNAVLAARGTRVLTSEETRYYNALIEAMRQDGPAIQQAINHIEVAIPETIIDAVMDDIESQFPLLAEIDFRNATGITSWIINKQGVQEAKWGTLGSKITEELSGDLDTVNLTQCKLTAYMVVSKDFLALGPAWLDRYVRAILAEANGIGLEKAVVDGDGSVGPIGMSRDLSNGSTLETKTTYQRKEAVEVTCLDPVTYGKLLEPLTKTATGRSRILQNVVLIVSPADYLTKVMPATTILTPQGTYVSDVLPYPTKVIQSVGVEAGHAILGLARRYFAGLGTSKKGFIEYSDHAQFLDDNRVYTTHLYGNGRPMDNNAFQYLDISKLQAPVVQVKVSNPEDFKASEAV